MSRALMLAILLATPAWGQGVPGTEADAPRTAVVKPTMLTVPELVALEAQAPPPVGRGERLDALHDSFYVYVEKLFESLDRQFIDEGVEPVPVIASPFRIALGTELIDRGGSLKTDINTEFDVTLRLPNAERRLKVFLTTEELSETSTVQDSGSSVRAGLRLGAARFFDFEIGAKLDVPPVAFAAVRWSHRFRSGPWDVQPYAKLFAETDEGVGASAALVVNRWHGRTLFRTATSAKWLEERSATEWAEVLSVSRVAALLEPDRYSARLRGQDLAEAWGMRLQVGGYEISEVDYYEASLFLKRPIHSDWLYVGVQPLVRWDREFAWRADPGNRICFAALFWDLARGRGGRASRR